MQTKTAFDRVSLAPALTSSWYLHRPRVGRMPGAVTKPKTSPWKVAAQNVEERIKFKHHNSRTVLAPSNAKIHRPGLHLTTNRTSSCSNSSKSTVQLNTTLCNRNSSKTKSSKRADKVKCRGTSDSKPNKSGILSSDACGRTVTKLDSRMLRCSCKIALDANECKKSRNPLKETEDLTKSVKLKIVNVNPWTNDGVKTPRNVYGVRSPKTNLTRLVSLLQECNDVKNCSATEREGTANRAPSCHSDDGTPQYTSQKLLIKPGRIACSHRGVSKDSHLCENCLSGILLVTSKIPSNPWPFQQEKVSPNKAKSDFPVFERGPRLSKMKKVCHLCEKCRKTFQNVSLRVHGPDMESENLTRLKYKLKLKERELLNMESHFGKTASCNSHEHARDEPTECKLREKFTLPELYLTHHSTALADHPKSKKARTKMTNSIMPASERCSNATKQRCYKLAKVERLDSASSPRDKLDKNLRAKMLKAVQGSFSEVLVPTTPLRGFTPLCLTESPMLWRKSESEDQDIEQEKEMTINDWQLGEKREKE